jgi:hypothetical protein
MVTLTNGLLIGVASLAQTTAHLLDGCGAAMRLQYAADHHFSKMIKDLDTTAAPKSPYWPDARNACQDVSCKHPFAYCTSNQASDMHRSSRLS